MAGWLAGRC